MSDTKNVQSISSISNIGMMKVAHGHMKEQEEVIVPNEPVDKVGNSERNFKGVEVQDTTATVPVVKKQKKKKKRKNQCNFKDCSNSFIKYIGDCRYCEGKFCSKHRLLENHSCTKLDDCKKEYHQRNAARLAKEQTNLPKISSI